MKRTLPALLLVLVLAAGGAAVFYARKGVHDSAAVAGFLPSDTLLFLSIPDPGQTGRRWQTTDLYKIWSEPEVQAFLAKPLAKIPPDKTREDTLAELKKVRPTDLFIALTALDEGSNHGHLLAGFQFQGESSDVDRLIAPAKESWRGKYPAGKADLVNFGGHSLETFASGDGTTIGSVYLGHWYLVSNDLELLKTTIDRVDHHAPPAAASLDKDGDFQKVTAKLPAGYESLVFARVQPFVSRIFALAAASGQPINEETRKQTDKARAFGATTKIEDGKIRDTLYYFAPGLEKTPDLNMGSLALSSADTLLYFDHALRLPDQVDLPGGAGAESSLPDPFAVLRAIGQQLQSKGITLQTARDALGSEAGFQLDWPANSAQPSALWSVDVKNIAAAGQLADALTSLPVGEASWKVQQAGALTLHVLTVPGFPAVQPTLAVTGKNLILGLSVAGVKAAVARGESAASNLSQSATYKTAAAEVEKPNQGFGYVDSRTLFERAYGELKPAAMLGAALFYPQANDYVDLAKLPPAETIAKHLSPTVMSSVVDADGALVESTGSVTIFQAGTVLFGGAAAAAAPYLQNQLGGH